MAYCTLTGAVVGYDGQTIQPGSVLTAFRAISNVGSIIASDRESYVLQNDGTWEPLLRFERDSIVYLHLNAPGYDNDPVHGFPVQIPDEATAALSTIAAAVTLPTPLPVVQVVSNIDLVSAVGQLGDSHISSNIARRNEANTFTEDQVVSGNVDATSYTGDGSGLTGIGSGTGGVINTGSTTIGADSDGNGVGEVVFQINSITKAKVRNDGHFSGIFKDYGGQVWNAEAFGIVGDGVVVTGVITGGTDNTAAIQDAIDTIEAAGGGCLFFSAGCYLFGSNIDLSNTNHITFAGPSSPMWPFSGAVRHPPAFLVYTGTGSGDAITAGSSWGLNIRDLGIYYKNNTFTGILLNAGVVAGRNTTSLGLERMVLGSWTQLDDSASALLMLHTSVTTMVRTCYFVGAEWAVAGLRDNTGFANEVTFDGCVFGGCSQGFIRDFYLDWILRSCTFEFWYEDFTTGTPYGISSTFALLSDVPANITIDTCSFWDPTSGEQIPIYQPAGNLWHLDVRNCYFNIFTNPIVKLLGPGTVTFEENRCDTVVRLSEPILIDLGNPATAMKEFVSIRKNRWLSVNDGAGYADTLINNVNGHKHVLIENNSPQGAAIEVRTITAQERLGYRSSAALNKPTIAAHSGQTLSAIELFGTDTAGLIIIYPTGSGTNAGLLADITFSRPYSPYPLSGAVPDDDRVPCVQLTPAGLTAPTVDGANSAAAQPFVKTTANTQTGFVLGTKNAVPASTQVAYFYRVIQI